MCVTSKTIFLIDNDIILKLAHYDLINDVIKAYKLSKEAFRILDTAEFYFRKNEKLKNKYSGVEQARAFAENAKTIEIEHYHNGEIKQLSKINNIDVGEKILFLASAYYPEFYVVTGDKRSLISLAENKNTCKITYKRLKHRCICFEQIILFLIKVFGDGVLSKMVYTGHCETAMKAIFGTEPTLQHVVTGLQSYINDCRKETGQLIIKK